MSLTIETSGRQGNITYVKLPRMTISEPMIYRCPVCQNDNLKAERLGPHAMKHNAASYGIDPVFGRRLDADI